MLLFPTICKRECSGKPLELPLKLQMKIQLCEKKRASFPPKPKDTPALHWYHFGAFKGAALTIQNIKNSLKITY